jgi:HPt (histidine-containing phosphotransfer) domain-containing protein
MDFKATKAYTMFISQLREITPILAALSLSTITADDLKEQKILSLLHMLKGSASMFGYGEISVLAHELHELLNDSSLQSNISRLTQTHQALTKALVAATTPP